MKITGIQLNSLGNVKDNFQKLLNELNLLKEAQDLIVLQELCLWDYFCIEEKPESFDEAIEHTDKIIVTLAEKAKSLQSVIVFPYFERRSKGIYHNSAYVFDKDGSIAGHYRKMHIPDDPGFYEKYYFIPGDTGFEPIETSVGKLGVLICWDQWFPEAARIMALKGADVLIYPTAIGWDDTESPDVYQSQLEAWQTMMRSHSIANGIPTIAVNRTGKEGHLQFWGNSFITNSYGQFLWNSPSHEESIFTQEIDLSTTEEARRIWPFFRDRRVDEYLDLLEKWMVN